MQPDDPQPDDPHAAHEPAEPAHVSSDPGSSQPGFEAGSSSGELTQDERTWGMLAHLLSLSGLIVPFGNVLGPLVLWLARKGDSVFVEDQARESLNFQLTVTIAYLVSFALFCVGIGVFVLPAVIVAQLVMVIIAAVRANGGELYRYPWTLRLVR